MTACVNRKHTKKVAAVVTASLVGALSLGAAPVAAMADTAGTGIDLQAADWYTGATVTAATDGQGGTVSDPAKATFTVGSDRYLKPIQVKNSMGDTTDLDTDNYVYKYYKNNNGAWNLVAASDGSATYRVGEYFSDHATADSYRVEVVKKNAIGELAGPFTFKLVNASSDTTYSVKGTVVYNGEDQKNDIDFVDQDGNPVSVSVDSWQYADGKPAGSVTNAGTYYATFTDGEVATVTVQPLDLSNATVVIPDLEAGAGAHGGDYWNADVLAKATFNGASIATRLIDESGSDDILKISSRSNVGGYKSGVNTVTISGTSAAVNSGNIKGSATVEFTIYDQDVADVVRYGRQVVSMSSQLDIYLEDGDSFDASKIKVENTSDGTTTGTVNGTYSGDQIELSYAKKDGSSWISCDAAALAEPGTYKVYVRVVPNQDFATDDWMGGSEEFQVVVTPTSINADRTAGFYFDGELAGDSTKVVYDGTDQLDKLEIVVKNAAGETMVEGTDYDVKIEKNGKKVDKVVDADGNPYKVTVEPKTFAFVPGTDAEFEITVVPVKVDTLKNVSDVSYTGSAIEVPVVSYLVKDVNGNVVKDEEGEDVYATLPSDLYNVVSIKKGGKTVKEIKEAGKYEVSIALVEGANTNYSLTDSKFDVTVKEFGQFSDVQPDAWYAQSVENAWTNWYINGISGTNFYAPEADITRADAVCILFNMAGGFSMSDEDFSYSEITGYNTGFNDVDGHAYFAKALAWAHTAGIANGSNGDFRPYDKITREEFASLLANFAKNKGEYSAAANDALDGMSDANTVSDWAEDNVAWAVENGVMGNGGFVAGQSNITRAEVAAMAVNYQPKALVKLPADENGNPLR